jgi:hypothetical protein
MREPEAPVDSDRAATQYRQVPQDHHLMQEFQPLRGQLAAEAAVEAGNGRPRGRQEKAAGGYVIHRARSVPGFGFYDGLIPRHILRELVPTMRHGDKGGRAFD